MLQKALDYAVLLSLSAIFDTTVLLLTAIRPIRASPAGDGKEINRYRNFNSGNI
jgi:hypothetical protein